MMGSPKYAHASNSPWKRQKTFGFLTFLGDTEMEHEKIGQKDQDKF